MNVLIGLSFILFDICISLYFCLGLSISLLIASLRGIGQLAVVASLLRNVFETENPWLVMLIAFVLNLLGTLEVVVNKSPRYFKYMFPTVLCGMLSSTVPISIIGAHFAMSVQPFWKPTQYIPLVGMLCGSSISGILVSTSYILKELTENSHKVEVYLAFGGSRAEACRPLVVEALRLALMRPINQMSVLGIISIPGMMTGAILGGADVAQAARLQMTIMFMITASTSLAAMLTSFAAVTIIVDNQHRVRDDRVTKRGSQMRRFTTLIINTFSSSPTTKKAMPKQKAS
ncbi:hypothetical protein BKA70DRAFT_1384245 [Coprinopsis sp. MPI-PUGE-AT-0042]|nr:hypothetical protein BKA70DRAFT_1384245 [Coprinopsis sp. MPI-PUGE-AT-0042]